MRIHGLVQRKQQRAPIPEALRKSTNSLRGLVRRTSPSQYSRPWQDAGGDLTKPLYMYIHLSMRTETPEERAEALFELPCACQDLRRATRVVTRIYDQELAKAGIEITQFGLLTALDLTAEANQKRLSAGFAMDSTTLTRTLRLMLKQGWIRARRGKDKRERLFSLTRAGRRQLATAQPCWESAQRRLRKELGDAGWTSMKQAVSQITGAALEA